MFTSEGRITERHQLWDCSNFLQTIFKLKINKAISEREVEYLAQAVNIDTLLFYINDEGRDKITRPFRHGLSIQI